MLTKNHLIRSMRGSVLLLIIIMMMSSAGCASQTPEPEARRGTPVVPKKTVQPGSNGKLSPRPWTAVRNWAYWLDNPDLKQLGGSNYQLVVIDYSADGSASKAFSQKQIEQLRRSSCQKRVVAYLSIGQAESYRGYWQKGWKPGSPDWLGQPDSDWRKNNWVRYWDPAWQKIIYAYLDKIIAAGFDGIYLDRIDAYQQDYADGHEDDMVKFVQDLAGYARAHSSLKQDFGIIAQNAEDLAADHDDYVRTVTGIAREEVYVGATNKTVSKAQTRGTEANLDRFRKYSQGHLVLTVDYVDRPELMHQVYQQARARSYVPYVTGVGLNRLQTNQEFNPGCDPQ